MGDPILSVKNLTVHFHTEAGVVKALEDVSFSVGQGEVLGLVGETGCGKICEKGNVALHRRENPFPLV